nr:LD-carboxypeptidase [uncultured Anaeromusa sp.]
MKSLIKPKPLRPGDTLGLLAPASPGKAEELEAGVHWLQAQGFQVRLGKSAAYTEGICAGTDALRIDDLHTFFADPSIAGILCIRGGYGSMRLLPQLDFELIKRHPKVFMGYSDITALHTFLQQQCGLVSFHGPMAASDFGREPRSAFTCEHSLRALTSTKPLGELPAPPAGAVPFFLVPGAASGPLCGGNLSLIAATLGTPYELDTTGRILCLEEVGEAPYRLDRLLTQLHLAGKLQAAAAIVMGVCSGCDSEEDPLGQRTADVLRERLGSLGKPVLCDVSFGHTPDKLTLPLGVQATISPQASLALTEAALEEAPANDYC